MAKKLCQFNFLWLGVLLTFGSFGVMDVAWGDHPHPWQMNFQEAASPVMESIRRFHHELLIIISAIALVVTALLVYVIWRFRASKNPIPSDVTHNTPLEIVWTAIPVLILVVIGFPSFKLLKQMDKLEKPELTLKVTGHQWFWEYDYPDSDINFNAYIKPHDQLKPADIRMLAVDNEVILPIDTNIRILVTSVDVLHSWAVPAFGIKQDTVPGRLRETWVKITKPGTYYGQCSELCGQGHGYMPIAIRAIPKSEFQAWVDEKKPKKAPAPAKASDASAPAKAGAPAVASPAKAPTATVTPTAGATVSGGATPPAAARKVLETVNSQPIETKKN